ncbi:hypothetical protein ACWC9T_26905, partial [Kitasatospora sp. NPDC001159]
LDLTGHTVVPGFVDLHVHGGGGASYASGIAPAAVDPAGPVSRRSPAATGVTEVQTARRHRRCHHQQVRVGEQKFEVDVIRPCRVGRSDVDGRRFHGGLRFRLADFLVARRESARWL